MWSRDIISNDFHSLSTCTTLLGLTSRSGRITGILLFMKDHRINENCITCVCLRNLGLNTRLCFLVSMATAKTVHFRNRRLHSYTAQCARACCVVRQDELVNMADGRLTVHARSDVFIRVNRVSRIVLARCVNSASTNPDS